MSYFKRATKVNIPPIFILNGIISMIIILTIILLIVPQYIYIVYWWTIIGLNVTFGISHKNKHFKWWKLATCPLVSIGYYGSFFITYVLVEKTWHKICENEKIMFNENFFYGNSKGSGEVISAAPTA